MEQQQNKGCGCANRSVQKNIVLPNILPQKQEYTQKQDALMDLIIAVHERKQKIRNSKY